MRRLIAIVFLLACGAAKSATHTAASASRADVGAAYALCAPNDTLAIPAGTARWTSTLNLTIPLTIQGAGGETAGGITDGGNTIIIDDITNTSAQQLIKFNTSAGQTWRMTGIEFRRGLFNVTGVAATNVLTTTAHGLAVGDTIQFPGSPTMDPNDVPLAGGAGITGQTNLNFVIYKVKSVPTADTFTIHPYYPVEDTTELDFTTNLTAGQWYRYRSFSDGAFQVLGLSQAVRIDHCSFINLKNNIFLWLDAYGVIDNCEFELDDSLGRVLLPNFRAIGTSGNPWGDDSWEVPYPWGGPAAVYVETCNVWKTMTNADMIYGMTDTIYGGGRFVVRKSTLTNVRVDNHGTETGNRFRSGRSMEVYDNTFSCWYSPASAISAPIDIRGGGYRIFRNTFTGTFNTNIAMSSYRTFSYNVPWGVADGTRAWDAPDLTDGAGTPGGAGDGVFESGTLSAAGSNSATDGAKSWTTNQWAYYSLRTIYPNTATSGDASTVTVSGASWTANQWTGYEFIKNSDNSRGRVASNTATVLTLDSTWYRPDMTGGGAFTLTLGGMILSNTGTALTLSSDSEGTPRTYRSGLAYEIRKLDKVLDDIGLGTTTAIIATDQSKPNHQNLNQQLDPAYHWLNTTRLNPSDGYVAATATTVFPSLKANRNYYAYTASFTGATGVGSGTLAARPATCTTGVAYWATDQGEWDSTNGATPDGKLYIATGTNTWSSGWMPYTYPHPLATGGGDTTAPALAGCIVAVPGTTITLTFSEVVTRNSGTPTVSLSGGACSLSYSSGSGSSSHVYTLSRTVYAGETGTLSAAPGANGWEDAAGNDFASVTNDPLTNNSTATPVAGGGSVTFGAGAGTATFGSGAGTATFQ